MEQLTHKGACKQVHPEDSHPEWEEKQNNSEEELDELVDYDGSLLSSKIPLGINKANKVSKSTSDDVVKTAHQKGSGFGYYYKRYWGEAYELGGLGREHPSDTDVDEDIDLMSAAETTEYFEDEYELSPAKAERKASEYGKVVDGSLDEFHSEKQRIVEMSEQKMRDMLEILLSKDERASEQGLIDAGKEMELLDDETSEHPFLNRMGSKFKRACDAQGISPEDILNGL